MSSTEQAEAGTIQTAIEGELTIFTAAGLRERLLPALSAHREIELDLSGVTEVDGAGLQFLVALKKEAVQQQIALRLVGHSTPVTAAIDLCGLSAYFGDPIVISSSGLQGR